MAKQQSPVTLRGTIGDVTYFMYDGKYYCKKKNALPSELVQNHPAFAPFRRQHQISSRCITLAAAIYRLVPESRRIGKLYRSIVKWTCHPDNRYQELIPLIHEALLHFNILKANAPLSEQEQCIQQVYASLPFKSLLPEEDPTPIPKKERKRKYTEALAPAPDNLDLSATLKQMMLTLTEIQKRLCADAWSPAPAPSCTVNGTEAA